MLFLGTLSLTCPCSWWCGSSEQCLAERRCHWSLATFCSSIWDSSKAAPPVSHLQSPRAAPYLLGLSCAHSTHQSLILVSTSQDERPWSDLFGPGTMHDLKKAIPSSRGIPNCSSAGSGLVALVVLALSWVSSLCCLGSPGLWNGKHPRSSGWGPEPRQDLKPSIYWCGVL